MSNTGIADNSVGGNVTNPVKHNSDSSRDAQDRANSDYGSSGPSAGYDNNVEKDFGERKQEGGVKGLMNKITDKMHPSHDQPVQKVSHSFYSSEDLC
jgi:hypothetical protein